MLSDFNNGIVFRYLMERTSYRRRLIDAVIEQSYNKTWEIAVQEWSIIDCEEDDECQSECICGKENIKYLFTIQNEYNKNELFPIGSKCIKKFGRQDLDDKTACIQKMYQLFHAINNGDYVTLNATYFSKKLIVYLYERGAFQPNAYNQYNGENDCKFLLSMFSKRNISPAQQRKINGIIAYSIKPFLMRTLHFRKTQKGSMTPCLEKQELAKA